jgi:hypothetical protein
MAATYKDAVDPIGKSPDYMQQVDPGRAHHPDKPYMRRVLKTGNPAQVSPSIAAPIAYDAYHLRLKVMFCTHFFSFQIPN